MTPTNKQVLDVEIVEDYQLKMQIKWNQDLPSGNEPFALMVFLLKLFSVSFFLD